MKRDIDLVRAILLAIEADPNLGGMHRSDLKFDAYDTNLIDYHIAIMGQAGLIEAGRSSFGPEFAVRNFVRLTWRGHDDLELMRNEAVWQAAKSQVKGAFGDTPYAEVKARLEAIALKELGIN